MLLLLAPALWLGDRLVHGLVMATWLVHAFGAFVVISRRRWARAW